MLTVAAMYAILDELVTKWGDSWTIDSRNGYVSFSVYRLREGQPLQTAERLEYRASAITLCNLTETEFRAHIAWLTVRR